LQYKYLFISENPLKLVRFAKYQIFTVLLAGYPVPLRASTTRGLQALGTVPHNPGVRICAVWAQLLLVFIRGNPEDECIAGRVQVIFPSISPSSVVTDLSVK
jgi:hypothetical protein